MKYFTTILLLTGLFITAMSAIVPTNSYGAIANTGQATNVILDENYATKIFGGAGGCNFWCCQKKTCPYCRDCMEFLGAYVKYSNFISNCYCSISLAAWESCTDVGDQLCSSTATFYSDSDCTVNPQSGSATCSASGCKGGSDDKCWGNHDCD